MQEEEHAALIAEDEKADRQRRPAWWGLVLWAALIAMAVWRPKWRLLLVAIGLCTIAAIVYTAAGVAWAWARGVKIRQVGIFFGNWLVRFSLLGLPIRINCVPTGAYVTYAGMDDPSPAGRRQSDVPYEQTYTAQPRLQKIALNLLMPLAMLALAAALLGPSAAFDSFLRGFEQFTLGAFRPRAYRVDAFARLFERLAEQKYALVLGIVAAKQAAMNLLPIPVLNGGTALLELLGLQSTLRPRSLALLQVTGLLVVYVLSGIWVFALAVYLFR